jgi:ribonuclease VapC
VIAVDTSALIAVLLGEAGADACAAALRAEPALLISAATVAEALIVAERRGVGEEMRRLIGTLGFQIVDVTAERARRVAQAYGRWGKGARSAGLNFGDCFAYALAKEKVCPLLYVGRDFAKTDVARAL